MTSYKNISQVFSWVEFLIDKSIIGVGS